MRLGGYPLAPENDQALWIDALYVLPDYRGQGIGSKLIAIAEGIAARSDERIHAFTDIPGWYEKHGWHREPKDLNCGNWTVVKSLPPDRQPLR